MTRTQLTETQKRAKQQADLRKEWDRHSLDAKPSKADINVQLFAEIVKLVAAYQGTVVSCLGDPTIRFEAPLDVDIANQLAAFRIGSRVVVVRQVGMGEKIIDGKPCAVRRYCFSLEG